MMQYGHFIFFDYTLGNTQRFQFAISIDDRHFLDFSSVYR
jgi:hypothetical protein